MTSVLLVGASSAAAATVGQAVVPVDPCDTNFVAAQTAVAGGTSYTVPFDGVLTSFSTRAYNPEGAGTMMKLVVFRADAATPGSYLVVGVSDVALTLPASAPAADIVTPITPIAVQAGDIIGVYVVGATGSLCVIETDDPGDAIASDGNVGPTAGDTVELFSDNRARLSIAANLESGSPAACDPTLAPVGCWAFDEPPASTTAIDSSPFANHGTYLGNPTLGVPGVRNTAVTLDGVDDLVRVPDSASLDVGDSFTLEGWIKRSPTTKSHTLFNKGTGGFQLTVLGSPNANKVVLRKAGVTTIAQSSAGVPADGAYHHVVATKNGPSTAKIYIDGVEGTTPVSPVQVIQNTAAPLFFGATATTPATYDEFAVYDRALTAAEVAARHAAGLPG